MQLCYYLILTLSFVISFTLTDVILYKTPITLSTAEMSLKMKNLMPRTLSINPGSIVFDQDEASLSLGAPLTAEGVADVAVAPMSEFNTYNATLVVDGALKLNKDHAVDGCTSEVVSTDYCNLTAVLTLHQAESLQEGAVTKFDLCDTVANAIRGGLTSEPLEDPPALGAQATVLSSSLYFYTLQSKARLGSLIGLNTSAEFVSHTSMRMTLGALTDVEVDLDTSVFSSSWGLQLLGTVVYAVYDIIKAALSLPSLGQFLSATVSNGKDANISISVSDGDSFLQDLIKNRAQLVVQSFLPKSSSVSFDIVAEDLRCKLFGLSCTVPVDGGIRVINTRVHGLGDADAIASKIISPFLEGILNDVVMDVITIRSSESNGRVKIRAI